MCNSASQYHDGTAHVLQDQGRGGVCCVADSEAAHTADAGGWRWEMGSINVNVGKTLLQEMDAWGSTQLNICIPLIAKRAEVL